MSNRAWVTLATNDSYSLGALVLAHSLRRVSSKYPAVILITPSVTDPMRERLRTAFADVIVVDVLDSQDAAHLALLQRPELGVTFTKIHCWCLTQFEKCVFLDADTLVVQNCDELFEREELSAAPDVGWPDCFNSGVFVYRPSQETFDAIIKFAKERGSFDGGDQGLLNSYFSSWAHADINKHLPFLYNVTSAAFYSYLPALTHFGQDLKIIHFIGTAKPWLQTYNWENNTVDAAGHLKDTLQLWWDIFVSSVHPQLDVAMVVEGGPPELLPPDTISYYIPEVDPDSIFPWHHTNPTSSQEEERQELDLSLHFDPWNLYVGDIPIKQDFQQSKGSEIPGRVELTQEMKDYIWDYKNRQNTASTSNASEIPMSCSSQTPASNSEKHHQHSHYSEHQVPLLQHESFQSHQHDHGYNSNFSQKQQSQCHDEFQQDNQHHDNRHHHDYYFDDHYHHKNHHYLAEHHHHNDHHEDHHHHNDHYHHEDNHHNYDHYHHDDNHQHKDHHHNDDQNHHDDHHSHGVHHHHDDHRVANHHVYHQHEKEGHRNAGSTRNIETQVKSNNTDHPLHSFEIHMPRSHGYHRHDIKKTHHVTLDVPKKPPKNAKKRAKRLHRIDLCYEKALTNGDLSSEDGEDLEEVEPRHPYDGFYLRHRATIDSYGRKICTNQIPPTPPPTPPPESPETCRTDHEEEVNQELLDTQTGVAGNLARVVPGAISSQREALDELTRRQGWEAGNIDYLGADSFDNIWAKISQTLNQSSEQPSPPKEVAPAPVVLTQPPKEPSPPRKQPSPPKEQPLSAKQPSPPKEQPLSAKQPSPPKEQPKEPSAVQLPSLLKEETTATVEVAVVESTPAETPKEVEAIAVAAGPPKSQIVAPAPDPETKTESVVADTPPDPSDIASTIPVTESVPEAAEPTKATPAPEAHKKSESAVPATPPVTPSDTASTTPVSETAPAVATPHPIVEAPSTVIEASASVEVLKTPEIGASHTDSGATPEKILELSVASTDSPPLANTPSKEVSPQQAAKSEGERARKPAGKLQLSPPGAADPLPTPDSELEDAASLAQSIIASELATPTVTSPTPPAPHTPASPPPAFQQKRLSVDEPVPATPPAGPVSLAQIGVKPKPSIAAQIESSITESGTQPETPATPTQPGTPAELPKKKLVKKSAKKDAAAAVGADAPVPPPRKKEKKPKDK